jgi:hypothetical protein
MNTGAETSPEVFSILVFLSQLAEGAAQRAKPPPIGPAKCVCIFSIKCYELVPVF